MLISGFLTVETKRYRIEHGLLVNGTVEGQEGGRVHFNSVRPARGWTSTR